MEKEQSTAQTRRVYEDWYRAWTSRDVATLVSLFTDDCTFEDVPNRVHHGKREVEELVRNTPGA